METFLATGLGLAAGWIVGAALSAARPLREEAGSALRRPVASVSQAGSVLHRSVVLVSGVGSVLRRPVASVSQVGSVVAVRGKLLAGFRYQAAQREAQSRWSASIEEFVHSRGAAQGVLRQAQRLQGSATSLWPPSPHFSVRPTRLFKVPYTTEEG